MSVEPFCVVLAAAVAVTAAGRSLWSPCGLSMISTITPTSERARGNRYWLSVTWFVVGAALGGAAFGAAGALLSVVVAVCAPPAGLTFALVSASAVVAVASDVRLFGRSLPLHPRQVDETWLVKYRRWIYAGGFGMQIGSGVATYVMTAGVYLTVVLAGLTGSVTAAMALGTGFGFVRGLGILLSARSRDTASLLRVHERLERWSLSSRWFVVAVMCAVVVSGATTAASSAGAGGGYAVAIGGAVSVLCALIVRGGHDGLSGRSRLPQPASVQPRWADA